MRRGCLLVRWKVLVACACSWLCARVLVVLARTMESFGCLSVLVLALMVESKHLAHEEKPGVSPRIQRVVPIESVVELSLSAREAEARTQLTDHPPQQWLFHTVCGRVISQCLLTLFCKADRWTEA